MRELRKFEITCSTTFGLVWIETRDWSSEMRANGESFYYRSMCSCGKEHSGCITPSVR
jgi:hypothetical protein